MASPAKIQYPNPKCNLQINLHRRLPQKLSFPTFSKDLTKSTPVRFPVIRACSSSSPSNSNPKPSLLKRTCIALTTSVALFSATYFITRPGLRPPVVTAEEASLESHLETQANDVEALLSLTKIKFEASKNKEAIEILNRLIQIEPDVQKWQLMKARILSHNGESQSAIKAFEEILAKDPNRVDAYHYLVMENYDSKLRLAELEKRINEAIGRCKKRKKEIRDFKMLIAQIRIIEGNSDEAIRICEELVKDDPEHYMIYMLKALVYTLMGKKDEAAKQFQQVAMILPENHPFIEFSTNPSKASEWRAVVAYDDVLCYMAIFTKLVVTGMFSKFG